MGLIVCLFDSRGRVNIVHRQNSFLCARLIEGVKGGRGGFLNPPRGWGRSRFGLTPGMKGRGLLKFKETPVKAVLGKFEARLCYLRYIPTASRCSG